MEPFSLLQFLQTLLPNPAPKSTEEASPPPVEQKEASPPENSASVNAYLQFLERHDAHSKRKK